MAESVDAGDSKSPGVWHLASSSLAPGMYILDIIMVSSVVYREMENIIGGGLYDLRFFYCK